MKVLMVDIGGTNVKMMASGHEGFRKFPSGRELTAAEMVKGVKEATKDWEYEAISIGFPGLVAHGEITRNPLNLGGGWVGYNFKKAFGKPVRIMNDAAMQALSHYDSGRLLFMGFGTSVGAALIADDVVIPLEVGLLRISRSQAFMDRLSKESYKKDQKAWQEAAEDAIFLLRDVFWPDQVVIGGGNAEKLDPVPEKVKRGNNQDTFRGAVRLWPGTDMMAEPAATTWRIKRKRVVKKKK
jgi:predicted NBD/HSP70 family sugar kinase